MAVASTQRAIGPLAIQITGWINNGPVDQYLLSIEITRRNMVPISDDKDHRRATEGFHGLTRLNKTSGPSDRSEFSSHSGFFAYQGVIFDKSACTRLSPGGAEL